ncbi:dNA segregation ATPase FtsK/SpoIIIE and related proteins [Eubacterium sp. CAG:115]|nr:dNA segregation ATPase FtsK/SpoIIIE and related proteins [Eubacterium sp. CAG:115]
MAENKTTRPRSGSSKGSTGRSRPSKKALEAEQLRLREEALKASMRRRHIATVIMFAVGIVLTLAAVIPAGEGEGWRGFFDLMHGLFGYSAFLVGPLLIFVAIRLSAFKEGHKLGMDVLKCVGGILLLCAAVQIFSVGAVPGENFGEVIANLFKDGKEFRGGGVFALFIGGLLLLLGRLGATILIIILILVCVLLCTGITVADFTDRMVKPVRNAKDKAVEHHNRIREENRIAAEELHMQQDEIEKIQAEIDAEQQEKRSVAELSRAVFSVSDPEEQEPEPIVEDTSAHTEPESSEKPHIIEVPRPDPVKPAEPELPAEPDPAETEQLLEEQHEDSVDYMAEIKDYIMQKNRAVLEEAERSEKDPLEDEDAELVPIIDALHRFKEENPENAPVSSIEDLPENSITSSEESELPFDLDDVADEPETESQPQKEAAVPETSAPKTAEPERPENPVKPEILEVPRPDRPVTPPAAPAPERPAMPLKKPAPEELKFSDVYTLPPVNLLNPVQKKLTQADIDNEIDRNSRKLVEALQSFGVQTKLVGVSRGPSVTRYELQPAPGVKISKITGLQDDIALNLASAGVRIEAPIPNKSAVGIEVPNKARDTVFFRELVDTTEFKKSFDKKLETVLGKDISGAMVTCNIAKMPHLLIAGTTGSGKSVCVNSIIMSILMKSTPQDVRLIMVDPKKVEFMMYNGIPHLLIPVVTDPKKAAGALAWAVNEMLNRYKQFSDNNVRDFTGFNELAKDPDSGLMKMSHIVIFIDELADLMMASPKDVEDSIVRLAQMARAAGMHLVIATQRPTVNVVTGLIKANIPSRIALMVASQTDSRVILDVSGAEKLLGNGDMLYMPVGLPKPVRVQGCFVSDKEVERVVEFIKQTFQAEYDELVMEEVERQTEMVASAQDSKSSGNSDSGDIDTSDERLEEAIDFVVESGTCSTSSLQRRLKLGYGRAARLVDIMEEMGIVGPLEGSKPRQVLMTKQEWAERKLQQR